VARSKKIIFILVSLFLFSLLGCGKMQTKDEKVIRIAEGEDPSIDATVKATKEILNTYSKTKPPEEQALNNMIKKVRAQLEEWLGIKGVDLDVLYDVAKELVKINTNDLTYDDIKKRIQSKLFVLRWFVEKNDLDKNELQQKLREKYPNASNTAIEGLVNTLMLQDQSWIGGNGDTKINPAELAYASIVMLILDTVDFTNGVPYHIEGMVEFKMTKELLVKKLNQQIFGKYGQSTIETISAADRKLEVMKFAIRVIQFAEAVRPSSLPDGNVRPAQYYEVISRVIQDSSTINNNVSLQKLVQLYDMKFLGGNEDAVLNMIELSMLVTDYEFGHKLYEMLKNKEISTIFKETNLASIYRKVNETLLNVVLQDLLSQSSKEDVFLTAKALVSLMLTDFIFTTYDFNDDSFLDKDEAKPLFKQIGVNDPKVLRAFFADVGLEPKSSKIMAFIELLFKLGGKDKLNSIDVYKRISKVIDRLMIETIK
jgi:hypothetical protein